MTKINNRIDFSVIIGVNLANCNGDPMDENMPRRLGNSDIGLISDVCLKHKARMVINTKYAGQPGNGVFVVPSEIDNRSLASKIAEYKGDVDAINKNFFDVRAFGGVLIDSNGSSKEAVVADTDGTKNGNKKPKQTKKVHSKVIGPVSVSHAISLAPITITRMQISRCMVQNDSDIDADKKGTFGNKFIVSDAMYKFTVSVNARLTEKTGFSLEDVAVLEDAITNLFIVDASAARPAGSMWIESVVKVEHTSTDGSESVRSISRRHTVDGFDSTGIVGKVTQLV